MTQHHKFRVLVLAALIALTASVISTIGRAQSLGLQMGLPPAPTNCHAEPIDIFYPNAYITWEDNSVNEDAFEVEWYISGKLRDRITAGANSTSASMGRRVGSSNRYHVRAINTFGASAWSNWAHLH